LHAEFWCWTPEIERYLSGLDTSQTSSSEGTRRDFTASFYGTSRAYRFGLEVASYLRKENPKGAKLITVSEDEEPREFLNLFQLPQPQAGKSYVSHLN
jgi:hypothetical protein